MKYLFVGLGNIGPEYEKTRHNIGFMLADYIANKQDVSFSSGRLAFVTEFSYKSRKIVLIKPTTYMNLSGKAVQHWMNIEKIPIENIIVFTDDIALPYAKLRMRLKGSHGGHNGLRNIQELLGTDAYARLRFGVGNEFPKGKQVEFVLGEFSDIEMAEMPDYLEKCAQALLDTTTIGVERVMNTFNTK